MPHAETEKDTWAQLTAEANAVGKGIAQWLDNDDSSIAAKTIGSLSAASSLALMWIRGVEQPKDLAEFLASRYENTARILRNAGAGMVDPFGPEGTENE